MATPPIGTRIELGGEKEFRQAISSVNDGMRVLGSEMKLAQAQFAENANSVEALTKKNDILDRQILSQKDKIELLKAALQASAEKYGEADKKTMDFQKSLNLAEAELVNMERESKNAAEAIEKLKDGESEVTQNTKGLGDAVGALSQKFGITLPENVTNSLNGFVSFDAKTIAVAGSVVALGAAVVKLTQQLAEMTVEAARFADDILTTATITGISTKSLQEYAYAAELMDVSVETLTGSQTKLIRNMGNAQRGTAEAVQAFNKLGVSFADANGELRDSETVFWEAIDALGRMTNETERDAISMQIMGRSARDLNPLIEAGADAMKALGEEAHQTGYVLDTEALEALGAVDDAMQRWNNTIDGTKRQLSAQFAPTMSKVMGDATDFIQKVGDTFEETGLVESFGSILESVTALLDPLAAFIDFIGPGLKFALDLVGDMLAWLADTLNVIVGIFTLDWNRIKTGLGLNTSSGQLSAQGKRYYATALESQVWDPERQAWVSSWSGANASGDMNWRGGMTWVGENGPEQVYLPQGTQILNAQESRLQGGGDIININMTVKASEIREVSDLIRIMQNHRRAARMGV